MKQSLALVCLSLTLWFNPTTALSSVAFENQLGLEGVDADHTVHHEMTLGEEVHSDSFHEENLARFDELLQQQKPSGHISMVQSLLRVALRMKGSKQTPAMLTILNTINNLVNQKMVPDIRNNVATLQQQLNNAYTTGFGGCDAAYQSSGVPNVTTFNNTFNAASAAHRSCRSAVEAPAQFAYGNCSAVLSSLTSRMLSICGAANWLNINGPDGCPMLPGEGYGSFTSRLITYYQAAYNNITTMLANCQAANSSVQAQLAICIPLNSSLNSARQQCNGMQSTMDQASCNLVQVQTGVCTSYHQCYENYISSYLTYLTSVQQSLSGLQGQYGAILGMQCILNALLSQNTQVDCTNNTAFQVQAATSVNLVYPSPVPPQALSCPIYSSSCAGTKPYAVAQYGVLPFNTPATACSASCCPVCTNFQCPSGFTQVANPATVYGASVQYCCTAVPVAPSSSAAVPSPPFAPIVVSISFNINYQAFMQNSALQQSVTNLVTQQITTATGIPSTNINVAFASGSVIVNAGLTIPSVGPASTYSVSMLQGALTGQVQSMASSLATQIGTLPGISACATLPITVNSVNIATPTTTTTTTTTTSTAHSPTAGWQASFYQSAISCPYNLANTPLSISSIAPQLARIDDVINHPSSATPWSGLTFNDYFYATWTGYLKINTAGTYTFFTYSDAGSLVLIDGVVVVNNDGCHPIQRMSGQKSLSGDYHTVIVRYFETTGVNALNVTYSGPDTKGVEVVVPTSSVVNQANGPFSTGKKGLGLNSPWGATQLQALGASWYYNWAASSSIVTTIPFIPMVFSGSALLKISAPYLGQYVLAFNEPDNAQQASMAVADVLSLWPTILNLGNIVGGPPTANSPIAAGGWQTQFMATNSVVNFMTMHWYKGPNAQLFMSDVTALINTYNLPVWITEFAAQDVASAQANATAFTTTQVVAFINAVVPWMKSNPMVQAFAWRHATVGSSSLFNADGSLTATGSAYANA